MTDPLHKLERQAVLLDTPVGRSLAPLPDDLAEPAEVNQRRLDTGSFENPIIIAAIIWYRQTPERLARCVASLSGRADGFVALDGPFVGLADEPSSPEDNYESLRDAGLAAELRWDIFEGQVWGGEPQKRTAAARVALDLARRIDPDAEPWVLVIDSDEFLASDITPDAVMAYGHGTARMQSYRDGLEVDEGGSGAKMVRLVPNTEHLLWGPAHFDLRDMSIPKTYSGWEKALANEDVPAFVLGHDMGEKVIGVEYEAYNDLRRLQVEGKMMRVVEDYQRGSDHIVVRMDNEQIATSKWRPGLVVSFGGALLGQNEDGFCIVERIEPVSGHGDLISDIYLKKVDDEQAEQAAKVMVDAEVERVTLQRQLLAKRIQKKARKADRMLKRYNR